MVFVTVKTDFVSRAAWRSSRNRISSTAVNLTGTRRRPRRSRHREMPCGARSPLRSGPALSLLGAHFQRPRIHYDHPYVTKAEGYPERVVNGSLTTLLALELARAHVATPLKSMSSRAVRPMFVNRPFTVCGEPGADGKSVKLWAIDDQDALAMSVTADLR